MALTPGTRVGVYDITALIGAGGMGEVYRATDTNLKRQVALKVLPTSVAADADRLARFQREAEVLAALNHPHIAQIYGLEKSANLTALVMELVEGEDLSQLIERHSSTEGENLRSRPRGSGAETARGGGAPRGLPINEALPIAKQIAEALEAAHEQGIIHRDLKPANIKVRSDGTVKVLDFGLAKAMEPAAGSSLNVTQSPTITSPAMTAAGMILGTAAYMSPEQARGRAVDKRCDIWAFGCVLYEMLAGKRAFGGDDVTDTIVSIVGKDPDWAPIPTQARRLLEACLEKDPKRRLRDIADVWRLLGDSPSGGETAARPAVRSALPWTLATALLVALLGLAWFQYREPAPDIRTVRFTLSPPEGTLLRDPFGVSPDGMWVAFAAGGSDSVVRLWVRSLDSLDVRPLPGTEGVSASGLFWSPDSRYIGFVSGGALKKVSVSGGPPQTITGIPTTASFRGGAWNTDGVVIYGVANVGLMRVSESGGSPVLLTAEPGADTSPAFLPDGQHFLYSKVRLASVRGIFLGSVSDSPEQQDPKPLIENQVLGVVYAAQRGSSVGHILFERDGALMAQPFDARRLEVVGEATVVSADLAGGINVVRPFSASSAGVIVYRSGDSAALSSLLWFDRRGMRLGQVGEPGNYGTVGLSRDGKTLAVTRTDLSTSHVWTVDLSRRVFSRLNPGENLDTGQVISRDGRVAFTLLKGGIFAKRAGEVGAPELLVESRTISHANDWSRDGRFLIYDDHHPTQRQDLWVVALEGDRKPIPFLVTPADETFGQFSPNGRWVAYSSDESGRREVYVRGFAPERSPAAAVGQWVMSSAGGDKPRWSQDGNELFYIALDGKMMSVPVKMGASFEPGVAVPLFDTRVTGFAPYDVAPDGRFLINTVPESAASHSPLNVIMNWRAGQP